MLFKSLVRLVSMNLLFSLIFVYLMIDYKIREAERIVAYEIIREIANVSLVNRLYHPYCENGINIDFINPTLPICDAGYVCKNEKNHTLPFNLDMKGHDMARLEKWYPAVQDGGSWAPCDCVSASRIAIIVPFRDREEHFRILLNNLIPFLQRQKRAFRIFLIEQGGDELFNRAAVSNAGFIEANKLGDFDCFIFHDVDLLPINLCNIYICGRQPRHLAAGLNKFKYKMPYKTYCGGVLALHRDTVYQVNGFTNVMFGWGGEDDEIYARIKRHNLTVERYPMSIARYNMIKHKRDDMNPYSQRTMRDAGSHWKFSKFDGLNSARYNLTAVELHNLYTRIEIRFDGGPRGKKEGTTFFRDKVNSFRKQLTSDPIEREVVLNTMRQIRKEKAEASKLAAKNKFKDKFKSKFSRRNKLNKT